MSLASGARIGVYEVVRPLGAGGMGEASLPGDTVRKPCRAEEPTVLLSDWPAIVRRRRHPTLSSQISHE